MTVPQHAGPQHDSQQADSQRADSQRAGETGIVRLADIRDTQLSVDEVLAAVTGAGAGGIALFVGTVRDEDGGRGVRELSYSAHPSARAEMVRVADEIASAHQLVHGLAAVHRIGDLAVGDLAIVVAASAPHRGEAFAACRALTDTIKDQVPIWKRQAYTDDTTSWVGMD